MLVGFSTGPVTPVHMRPPVSPQLNNWSPAIQFSDRQKNDDVDEGHLARAAVNVQDFDKICIALEFIDTDIQKIKTNYRNERPNELPYQALYSWKQKRTTTTVGDLVSILSLADESRAIKILFDFYNGDDQ